MADWLSATLETEEKRVFNIPIERLAEPSFLPIYLTGGIGDAILSIPVLERLRERGYQMLVYSQHAKALRYFYDKIPIQEGVLPSFTWCIHLDSIVKFKFSSQFGGFSIPEHKSLFDQQMTLFKENPHLGYLVEIHPKQKFVLTRLAEKLGCNANTFALYSMGFKNSTQFNSLARKPNKNYITIHDGFDTNSQHIVSGKSTKQWSKWSDLVSRIKADHKDYKIIQLGSKTSRAIEGVDECLINKTSIAEAFDIISESSLHLDTDSGLAHAATYLKIPCVVLFGPTPSKFYGHPENQNITSGKNCSGGCFFLEDTWMDRCPIGYESPKCMDDINAESVMVGIKKILKENKKGPSDFKPRGPPSPTAKWEDYY